MNTKIQDVRIKKLNESMGWAYGPSPKDGDQYWVVIKGDTSGPQIATANLLCEKQWCYEDGECVGFEVLAYKKLTRPLFKV